MFQLVIDVLLAGLVLYAFLAAIFWFRKRSVAIPDASSPDQSGRPGTHEKP